MGPFQGYFQVLSRKNGEDIHITFQVFYCWANVVLNNTQIRLQWHTQTHTGTSLADPNELVKQMSKSVISSIFSQKTGSYYKHLAVISHWDSRKHCNRYHNGNVLNISINLFQNTCDLNYIELPSLILAAVSKIVLAKTYLINLLY